MLNIKQLGKKSEKIRIIWLHGWGHDSQAFLPIVSLFENSTENYLVDLPGFGGSTKPDEIWGTEEYAKNLLDWLSTLKKKPTYIVGHSLGGKIGMRMAYLSSKEISGLILISSAGLRIQKSLKKKIKILISKIGSPIYKKIQKFLPDRLKMFLVKLIGSRDYQSSEGIMRSILIKTVNEDLSKIAPKIKTKTLLIYGSRDLETPPMFGKKFNQLMKNSNFIELKGYDHYNILTLAKYQIQNLITKFLEENK
ncbi:alpha/beta fold hydrolase [Pseudomonadota bacterium]